MFLYLGQMDVPPVDAIYDRAALIALPEKVRPSYVEHCLQWLRPGGAILLKSMSYQGSMQGPPYSVEHSEIQKPLPAGQSVELFESN